MKLHAWAWLALSSFLAAPLPDPLAAATRPHYGGTLTVELSSSTASLEPLSTLVAETLVRLNQKGEIEPQLAVAWQRDADRKRWRFSLRPKVTFHDGEPLSASSAAPMLTVALRKQYGDVNVTAGGQTLVVQFDHAVPDLLTELTHSQFAVVRAGDKSPLIGTGPFRVVTWEPGHKLMVAAFEEYWAGRPFLDSVTISLGATRALGDVFDIPFAQTRRVAPEHTRIWTSTPHELIALVAEHPQPEVSEALALAIDRAPIVNVLAQKRAEAAFGLLPAWLSGYAFLFANPPDLGRAKKLAAALRLAPLTLNYPANDGFARSVAERVALNARDAGIILEPAPSPNGSLRLVRWRLESTDAASELRRLAKMLGKPEAANALNAANPESLYEAERTLLESHLVIPLVYLPDVFGIAPRVHNWDAGLTLHLENVWVDP